MGLGDSVVGVVGVGGGGDVGGGDVVGVVVVIHLYILSTSDPLLPRNVRQSHLNACAHSRHHIPHNPCVRSPHPHPATATINR